MFLKIVMYLTPVEISDRHLSCRALLIVEIHIDKNVWQNKQKTFANKFPRVCGISNYILFEHKYRTENSGKFLKSTVICEFSSGDA